VKYAHNLTDGVNQLTSKGTMNFTTDSKG